ncbi:MAG: DUF2207 domain-containing protein, partial [Calditrichia bacterium]
QDELLDFEKSLIDFIFTDLEPENGEVDIKAFTKHSTMVRKWFQDWKKLLKPYYEDVKMWDKPSIRGTVISIIISILVIAGGILVITYLGDPGFIAIFAGIICFGLSFTILRYTPDIREKRNKWEALRRYLKKYLFVNDMNTGWLSQIQIYLIYALAFGVGNKAIEKLLAQVPAEQQRTYFPWYYYAAGAHASPVEFAHAVSSMVSIASSSMSSSSGAGGGASGGGGGGGGGASGGAG